MAKYQSPYEGNEDYYASLGIHSEQELYDKQQELIDQQYDYMSSISDTKQSVVDMFESSIDAVEEYTETLIDGYNDYIDSVKEALDSERELYDFKKNVQKQAKDIAAIERRIASLSGSTNAADIAERRKLEAELYESRESLNDTYYEHAQTSQDEALDAEAAAYEEAMTSMIENMRASFEQATLDVDAFMNGVATMTALNAGAILEEYQNTGVYLDPALTDPWVAAQAEVDNYSDDALGLMDQWTQGGFMTTFPESAGDALSSPWAAGSSAMDAFATSVDESMDNVLEKIESNVKQATESLSTLTNVIHTTDVTADGSVGTSYNGGNSGAGVYSSDDGPSMPEADVKRLQKVLNTVFGANLAIDGVYGPKTTEAVKAAQSKIGAGQDGQYGPNTRAKMSEYISKEWMRDQSGSSMIGQGIQYMLSELPTTYYAKGTLGTPRDQWAITDEPQFGDELVLIPGKDGNLSYMRKGTGVVPADLTQKLFELAQIPTSDLMNKNLTAVVPNITKNDFKNEFNFESLVHVDTVDSDTLPKLEKMVDKKIDDFSKALNYSLKKFAR